MFQTSESCIKLHTEAVLEHFLSEQCPLLQVCVLGWVKYRERISLLVILCIIVYGKKTKQKKNFFYLFFLNRYPIMVKCLNIGKNIGKTIYRSISSFKKK